MSSVSATASDCSSVSSAPAVAGCSFTSVIIRWMYASVATVVASVAYYVAGHCERRSGTGVRDYTMNTRRDMGRHPVRHHHRNGEPPFPIKHELEKPMNGGYVCNDHV